MSQDSKRKSMKDELLNRVAQVLGVSGTEAKPTAVRELFSPEDKSLPMKTETHPRMVETLVRLKVLEEARNLHRTKSLLQIFVEEYDTRMISYNRKGRLELLGALQALAEAESKTEVPLR